MLVVMLAMMLVMILKMMLVMPFMTYNYVMRLQLEPMLPYFKLEHPQVWYHRLGLHVHSLVILFKVKTTMNDDLGIFYEGI
jgi:hypothetical protein